MAAQVKAGLEYREAFLQALLSGDERRADIAARSAIDAGLDELAVSETVIAPALQSICEMWEGGLICEEDGLEAERISMRVRSLQRGGEEVLLGELEGDPPTPELSDAAAVLRRAGFKVRHLGSGLPILSLTRAVARHRPHAVVLHVAGRDVALLLDYLLDEIDLHGPGTSVLVGGPGLRADLREEEAQVIAWERPSEIVAKLDSLVLRPSLN